MDNKKKALIGSIGAIIIVAVLLGVLFAGGNKSVSDNSSVSVSAASDNVVDVAVNNNTEKDEPDTNSSVTASGDTPSPSPSAESSDTDDTEADEATVSDDVATVTVSPSPATTVLTESGTPVANHGELYVDGTQIKDKNGNAYQLKGVSTHGIAWFPEYVNKNAFQTLRDEWGVNVIRLAMYSDEYNGYCSGGDQAYLKGLVENGVSYATELGMYVIIDWHVLGECDPNVHKADAKAFFEEMSAKYADYDNVIYEICNEPNGGTSWSSVKSYALEVIPIIKANNPNAIIIVGTPTWSQDVDTAANDPITGYTNIMYAVHFYADTHKDTIRNKVTTALSKGMPVFISEFGICDASGNGAINIGEANTWMSLIDSNGLSCCIWNLSNKNESSSLISSSCSKTSGWTTDDLSDEGKWYVAYLGGDATGTAAPASDSSSSSSSGSSSSGSTAPATTPAATASGDNTSVSVANSGGWNDGTNNYYQYTITVKNTSSSSVKDWKLTVNFSSNVTIDQSWSGSFTASGSSVTVSPADYNKEIAAGQSIEVGMIVYTSGTLSTPTVSIN